MNQSHPTDEELMADYQGGSEEAFQKLYDRHSGRIFGYLKSKVHSEQKAADLFQEVFVKIHRSKHLYNRSLPVLPWIFSIARNVMLDGVRSEKRKREVFDVDFDQLEGPLAEAKQSLGNIGPALEKLSDPQQIAIQMRYVDEKTFEEIAEKLKTSPGNVRQLISRAVKQMRGLMNQGEKP